MVKLPYKYIAIEGNIGVGKTTFAKQLTKITSANLLLERFEENPYLKDFYNDIEKFAYQTESYFLSDRIKQLENFLKNSTGLMISDFSIYKSHIFSKITLDFQAQEEFNRMFNNLITDHIKPDLILQLKIQSNEIKNRIIHRGRSYEQGIQDHYLMAIEDQYDSYWKSSDEINLLQIDLTKAIFPYLDKELEKLNLLKNH